MMAHHDFCQEPYCRQCEPEAHARQKADGIEKRIVRLERDVPRLKKKLTQTTQLSRRKTLYEVAKIIKGHRAQIDSKGEKCCWSWLNMLEKQFRRMAREKP